MKTYKTIDEFLADMDDGRRQQIQTLRNLITGTNADLTEHIKWNAPSYQLDGEDRITFNVRDTFPVMIVLHMGATKKEKKNAEPRLHDDSGLIEWKSDTRGVITFKDLPDIIQKQEQFTAILKQWLALV